MCDSSPIYQGKTELLTTVKQIVDEQRPIFVYCEEIKERVTSKDRSVRSQALTELCFVVSHLPNNYIKDEEAVFLLKFLSARFDDCGHSADTLVKAVYDLFFAINKFDIDDMDNVFHSIFDENGIQAYAQADRMFFLEILDHIATNYFDVIEKTGIQFYNIFANTAGGERDPRCLMKVFSIYCKVMQRMDLGPFMEDMFDLIACYYPIEYHPKETDKNPLSPRALSAGCEACLVSNRGFSLYTYQLLLEKLLDDDEDVSFKIKLQICEFLITAFQKFGPGSLLALADEYMAAFRMICFDPRLKTVDLESIATVGQTMIAMFRCLDTLSNDQANRELERAAQQMLENCEPFVLQAEMGLSARALRLLVFLVKAHEVCAELAVPKVLMWIQNLITGITVKSADNKTEILEETLSLVPEWCSLCVSSGQENHLIAAIPGILTALNASFQESPALTVRTYACVGSEIIASETLKRALGKELGQIFDSVLSFQPEDGDSETNKRAFEAFQLFAAYDFDSAWTKVEPILMSCQHWSTRECHLCCSMISDEVSFNQCSPLLVNRLGQAESDIIAGVQSVAKTCARLAAGPCVMMIQCLRQVIESQLSSVGEQQERLLMLGDEVQKLVHVLTNPARQLLLVWFVSKATQLCAETQTKVTLHLLNFFVPLCLCIKETTTISKLLTSLLPVYEKDVENVKPLVLAVLFAFMNRSSGCDCSRQLTPKSLEMEAEALFLRNLLLTNPKFEAERFEKVFSTGTDVQLDLLLDFGSRLSDPVIHDYNRTLLWTQRIVTQVVPCFVHHFKAQSSTGEGPDLVRLVGPILALVKRVSIPLTPQLLQMFPLILTALDLCSHDSVQLPVLVRAVVTLVRLSDSNGITPDRLAEVAYQLEKILNEPRCSSEIVFEALDGLEAVGWKARSVTVIFRWDQTMLAIRKATRSKKRAVRQKAAFVYNLWSTIPV